MSEQKKGNGRAPGQPGRNGKPKEERRGFSAPRPKEDRRKTADPWKLKKLLPPLSATEYEELKESIRRDGVLVPSIVDPDGNVVDGQNRERVCTELGIFCPREVREFSSDAEKLELAIRLNITRRHLNRAQKRELISALLKAQNGLNDRHVADIVKASKNTVAAERERLERTGQIDRLSHRLGRDGKLRRAKYRRIIANTPKEAAQAGEIIKHLPSSCDGKVVDMTTAFRRARRRLKKVERQATVITPSPDEETVPRIFPPGQQESQEMLAHLCDQLFNGCHAVGTAAELKIIKAVHYGDCIQSGENLYCEKAGDEQYRFRVYEDGREYEPWTVTPETDLSVVPLGILREMDYEMSYCGETDERDAKFSKTRKHIQREMGGRERWLPF